MLMSVSVKEHQNQNNLDYDFQSEYQNLINKEDKFEEDIKQILEFVEDSDMMSIVLDEETRSTLTLDTFRNWKSMFGKIYASKVTEDPIVYIWRPLTYLEYKQMVGTSTEVGQVKWDDQFLREDAILKKCLLFPKPSYNFLTKRRAGVGHTLCEQILYQSGFVPTEYAISKIEVLG